MKDQFQIHSSWEGCRRGCIWELLFFSCSRDKETE